MSCLLLRFSASALVRTDSCPPTFSFPKFLCWFQTLVEDGRWEKGWGSGNSFAGDNDSGISSGLNLQSSYTSPQTNYACDRLL